MLLPNATWVRWLLGIDDASVPENAELRLVWTNLPTSWAVFVLIGAVLAVIALVVLTYRRENDSCPRGVKYLLTAIRLVAMVLLLAVFLGPAVTYTKSRTIRPWIVLLRDASQSMSTADRYSDPKQADVIARLTGMTVDQLRKQPIRRSALVDRVLSSEDQRLLDELSQRGKLRTLDFAERTTAVERQTVTKQKEGEPAESSLAGLPALEANGLGTDLYDAIRSTLSEKLVAAVIAFTDGQHTEKGDLRDVAEEARNRNVPLLLVGVGDPQRPRNLQMSEVYADPQIWQDDPFEVQAMLRAQGIGAREVRVSLIDVTKADAESTEGEQIVEAKNVKLPEEGGQVRVTFSHTPKTAGRKRYTVEVESVEREESLDDNRPAAPIEVNVLDQEARVLLIAGAPSWEYRGVQKLLTREPSINLSCWLQTLEDGRAGDGNTPLRMLPATRDALFEFDVVIMLDPDAAEFDKEWIELLRQFVRDHAGGLFYMAGPEFAGRFLSGSRTGNLKDVLPVRFGDVGRMEVASLLATNAQQWQLGVVAASVDHPLMRFYPDTQRTLSQWQALPGIYWSFPAEEARPASRVLIEHTDPTLRRVDHSRPLLVAGQYGSGRTIYMGFNGTWRWRSAGTDAEFFKRFWVQTTRMLIEGRSLEGKRRGVIEADRYRYELGDRAQLTARLKDASYQPLQKPEVTATLKVQGGPPRTVTLKPVANLPGQYEATLALRDAGQHLVAIENLDVAAANARIETSFMVTLPSRETQQTWRNTPQLIELASRSGGRMFELDQLDELPDAIPDRTQTIELQSQPLPVWDTSRVLLLLVGLLGIEWAVRKRFKLY